LPEANQAVEVAVVEFLCSEKFWFDLGSISWSFLPKLKPMWSCQHTLQNLLFICVWDGLPEKKRLAKPRRNGEKRRRIASVREEEGAWDPRARGFPRGCRRVRGTRLGGMKAHAQHTPDVPMRPLRFRPYAIFKIPILSFSQFIYYSALV